MWGALPPRMKRLNRIFALSSISLLLFASGCAQETEGDTETGEDTAAVEIGGWCRMGTKNGPTANMTASTEATATGYRVTGVTYYLAAATVLPKTRTFHLRAVLNLPTASGKFERKALDLGQPTVKIKSSGLFSDAHKEIVIDLSSRPVEVPFGAEFGVSFSYERWAADPECDIKFFAFPDAFGSMDLGNPKPNQSCADYKKKAIAEAVRTRSGSEETYCPPR